MASFQQLANGKWQGRIRKKRTHLSAVMETEKQIRAWAQEEERKIENRVSKAGDGDHLKKTVWDLLLLYAEKKSKVLRGWKQEQQIINNIPDYVGNQLIKWLDEDLLRRYLSDLTKQKLKPSTIHKRLKLLQRALKIGKREWRGIRGLDDPFQYIDFPKIGEDDQRDRVATSEEIELFIKYTKKSPNLVDFIALALETAGRRGDLYKLKYEHIDFENSTALFLKGKTGDREVPLSDRAIEILKARQAKIGSAWVFPNNDKTNHINKDAMTRGFCRVRQRIAKMEKRPEILSLRLHDLRHTAATNWADHLDVWRLQTLTGHKTLKMLNRCVNKKAIDTAQQMKMKKVK